MVVYRSMGSIFYKFLFGAVSRIGVPGHRDCGSRSMGLGFSVEIFTFLVLLTLKVKFNYYRLKRV